VSLLAKNWNVTPFSWGFIRALCPFSNSEVWMMSDNLRLPRLQLIGVFKHGSSALYLNTAKPISQLGPHCVATDQPYLDIRVTSTGISSALNKPPLLGWQMVHKHQGKSGYMEPKPYRNFQIFVTLYYLCPKTMQCNNLHKVKYPTFSKICQSKINNKTK
jgi:hypothetical protein